MVVSGVVDSAGVVSGVVVSSAGFSSLTAIFSVASYGSPAIGVTLIGISTVLPTLLLNATLPVGRPTVRTPCLSTETFQRQFGSPPLLVSTSSPGFRARSLSGFESTSQKLTSSGVSKSDACVATVWAWAAGRSDVETLTNGATSAMESAPAAMEMRFVRVLYAINLSFAQERKRCTGPAVQVCHRLISFLSSKT